MRCALRSGPVAKASPHVVRYAIVGGRIPTVRCLLRGVGMRCAKVRGLVSVLLGALCVV